MKAESVLFWMDGRYAVVMALKMKAIGRDGAFKAVQRGPRDPMTWGLRVGRYPANGFFFERGRLSIMGEGPSWGLHPEGKVGPSGIKG